MASDVKAIQAKIDKLGEEVSDLDRRKAQLEGKLDSLEDQLKKDFKVDSIGDAEKQIKDMLKKVDDLKLEEAELSKEIDNLLEKAEV